MHNFSQRRTGNSERYALRRHAVPVSMEQTVLLGLETLRMSFLGEHLDELLRHRAHLAPLLQVNLSDTQKGKKESKGHAKCQGAQSVRLGLRV